MFGDDDGEFCMFSDDDSEFTVCVDDDDVGMMSRVVCEWMDG